MNPINAKSVQLIELHAFYYLLLLSFIAVYLTSSKSTASLYEQLARTCCKYSANPKISIYKQPQLFTAKIQIYLINIVI